MRHLTKISLTIALIAIPLSVFCEPFDGVNASITTTDQQPQEFSKYQPLPVALTKIEVEAARLVQYAVVTSPNLSAGGKNVFVSALNGKIILQGSVASEQESKIIYAIAHAVSPLPIDNQLVYFQ